MVYLIEPPRQDLDLSPARTHGEVKVLFDPTRKRGEGRRNRPSIFDMNPYAHSVLEALEEEGFDPARDHLLLTGSQLTVAIAFASLALRYGTFKVLVFNSSLCSYVEKTFRAEEALGTAHVAAVAEGDGRTSS